VRGCVNTARVDRKQNNIKQRQSIQRDTVVMLIRQIKRKQGKRAYNLCTCSYIV
jgi:hypothetical protein